jgi:hypothetical protein
MKQCTRCKNIKPLTDFSKDRYKKDGLNLACRECCKLPPARILKPVLTHKTCKVCNCTATVENFNGLTCKICIAAINQSKAPPKKVRIYSNKPQSIRKRLRRQRDPVFRLRSNIGTSIANALVARGYKKTSKTCEILGCTFQEFKDHIEKQFLPDMNWENRFLWHLDHIVPVSFATTEQELIMLNHYSNLRPLWGVENQNKAARLTTEAVSHSLYKTIIENRICDQKFCAQNFSLTADPILESNNGTI